MNCGWVFPRLPISISMTKLDPLPVVVRIYQLNDDAVFWGTDFADLWKTICRRWEILSWFATSL
jgi:hypothetical protein